MLKLHNMGIKDAILYSNDIIESDVDELIISGIIYILYIYQLLYIN